MKHHVGMACAVSVTYSFRTNREALAGTHPVVDAGLVGVFPLVGQTIEEGGSGS